MLQVMPPLIVQCNPKQIFFEYIKFIAQRICHNELNPLSDLKSIKVSQLYEYISFKYDYDYKFN